MRKMVMSQHHVIMLRIVGRHISRLDPRRSKGLEQVDCLREGRGPAEPAANDSKVFNLLPDTFWTVAVFVAKDWVLVEKHSLNFTTRRVISSSWGSFGSRKNRPKHHHQLASQIGCLASQQLCSRSLEGACAFSFWKELTMSGRSGRLAGWREFGDVRFMVAN